MIPLLPALNTLPLAEAGAFMKAHTPLHEIAYCNWRGQFPAEPCARFAIARSHEAFVISFFVTETDLLAEHTEPLSAVAGDSCVEWFVQLPGSPRYWNFEFNAIGTVNASHRISRPEPTRLTHEQIASIGRHSSLGTEPIALRPGEARWTLTVAVPFTLLGIGADKLPSHLMGNFYCCGGNKPHPHYLSWAPIHTERPDFHRPEFFAPITIDPQ